MVNSFFLSLLNAINLFREFFFTPVISTLRCPKALRGSLGHRLDVEKGYVSSPLGYFDYTFHVSSEGEWQQAYPLVDEVLQRKKKVLILYSSDSLSLSLKRFCKDKNNVSLSMIPLLSFKRSFYKNFETSKFYMVRYDFYPELLLLARRSSSTLISASLKNKSLSFFKLFLWKFILNSFERVLTATQKDCMTIRDLVSRDKSQSIQCLEFRHAQIISRQRDWKKHPKAEHIESLKNWASQVEKRYTFIFGSVWSHEIEVIREFVKRLKEENKEFRVLIAPHKLAGSEFEELYELLVKNFQKELFGLYKDKANVKPIMLCQEGGILCELYPYFAHAYIGGGFGRSIHSLLEPFWGECFLYFGPKIHRSTEYDFIKEIHPEVLTVLNDPKSAYERFSFNKKLSFQYDTYKERYLNLSLDQYL